MCNVIYKIIAKVLSNRLSLVLHHIMSSNQVGFINDRSISGNAMIGLDIMHHIYSKQNLNFGSQA